LSISLPSLPTPFQKVLEVLKC